MEKILLQMLDTLDNFIININTNASYIFILCKYAGIVFVFLDKTVKIWWLMLTNKFCSFEVVQA